MSFNNKSLAKLKIRQLLIQFYYPRLIKTQYKTTIYSVLPPKSTLNSINARSIPCPSIMLHALVPDENRNSKERHSYKRSQKGVCIPFVAAKEVGGWINTDEGKWQDPG